MPASLFRFLLVALCAGVLLVATAAAAQQGDAVERSAALFKEGKAAFQAGDYAAARAKYLEAWQLRKSPDIAANLGQVEALVGEHREAAGHFSFALHNLLPSSTAEQRAALEKGLAAAKQHVGTIAIRVEPAGAAVSVDGEPVDAALPVFVEPGEHTVQADLAEHQPRSERVTVAAGGSVAVELELEAGEGGLPSSGLAADGSDGPSEGAPQASKTPALIAAGVAVVGLGAGVGFLLAASSKASERDDLKDGLSGGNSACSAQPRPAECTEIQDLDDSRKTFTALSVGGFVLAGAGAVAAVLLWPDSPSEAGAVRIWPTSDGRSTGLMVGGAF